MTTDCELQELHGGETARPVRDKIQARYDGWLMIITLIAIKALPKWKYRLIVYMNHPAAYLEAHLLDRSNAKNSIEEAMEMEILMFSVDTQE